MKYSLFIISLLTLLTSRSTAQFVNQGVFSVSPGSLVSTPASFTNTGTVTNSGIMSLGANVTNNGTFDATQGELKLVGGAMQTLDGSTGITSRTLTLQNSAAGESIVLNVPLTVNQLVNFADGILKTNTTNQLILGDNALAVGAGDASHVVGPVQKIGDDNFTFPLGNGTTYRPASIAPQGTASDAYTAQYVESAPANSISLASCLSAISGNEYWQIDRTAGSGVATVGLAYQNVATSPAIANSPLLRVARYNGSLWEPISCSANGGTASGLVLTNGSTANFGAFTLGVQALAPTISGLAASSATTCVGSPVTFTATIGNVTGAYNFTLTNGSSTTTGNSGTTSFGQSLVASGSGPQTFTLTVEAGGQQATFTTSVTVNALPVATLLANFGGTLTCAQTSLTLTASGGDTYTFNGPGVISQNATSGTAIVNASGIYSVTVSSSGCISTTNITIGQNTTLATVSITPSSATLTCSTTSASLSAVGSSGTYLWSTNETTQSISTTAAGTYSVTLTGTNGCTATAQAQVFQNNTAPSVSVSPSSATLSCSTPTTTLTATAGVAYLWDTGATSQTISVGSLGTYSVTVTAGNGCTATAQAQVFQDNTAPSVSVSPSSATLSCTNSTVSLSAVGSGTYLWSTGAISQTVNVSSSGTYSVTITSGNGCTATASAQIVQDNTAPSISVSPLSATLSCSTPTTTLTATAGVAYLWSNGATSQTISVGSTGTYSVTVTAGNGCTATAQAQIFQNNTAASVSITPSSATLTCSTTSVSLSAVGSSGTYLWNTGATTQSISATLAGAYSVTLTANNGCTAIAQAQILLDNSVPSVNISATPSLTISSGQSTTLTATGATSYTWSTGEVANFIVVSIGGPFSVTGISAGGCRATASVVVSLTTGPAGPFAITAVTTNSCQQIAANRYVISFTPQYSGVNGQPISFSVVNELFPTTAPGPYTLQLYTDNSVIVFKAQQGGTLGEASFTYNWLAACSNPVPNTPPRVNQPLTDQTARVGEGFGYTIPQTTFTDNESPQSLVISVVGLPAGLSFNPPAQIGGVPIVSGVSSVTVTATDPQGLSVSTSFRLTVVESSATNTPPTLVNPVAAQVATQGQPFGLDLSNTFTDAQTPNALTLTVNGLPSGIQLVGSQLSGTPSMTGTSTVTLIATDPGGLNTSTQFSLVVQPISQTASTPFAITGVSPITCNQISANRYAISFQPRYAGLNGQVVSFWVVNELVPTTAAGPYSLQLYNDNPVIVLKARQEGSAGEATFSYNWLAVCGNPVPNTPPRVNQPLTDQTARVGEAFGYTIPQLTFTDNESSQSLVLSVIGLPAGLNFSPPAQIGGVPSVSGVSSVTVIATDPGGLIVSTQFSLTVLPAGAPSGFAITGVQTLSCVSISGGRRSLTFTPQYSGLNGGPVSFSIVNELLPTTASGPYTLALYPDNPVLRLRAQQGGSQAGYDYNWLAACNAPSRQGVAETGTGLQVKVLGNPVEGSTVAIEVRGVTGLPVGVKLMSIQGVLSAQQSIESAGFIEYIQLSMPSDSGVYFLQVKAADQIKVLKVIRR
ncbi:hypothetical protein GCM10028807_39840 [Spirosoma daeguense]